MEVVAELVLAYNRRGGVWKELISCAQRPEMSLHNAENHSNARFSYVCASLDIRLQTSKALKLHVFQKLHVYTKDILLSLLKMSRRN